jgi:formate C-acetyltransferase
VPGVGVNNGIRRLDGKQIGLETGDPRKFVSYEEVWEAYKTQAEKIYRLAVFFRSSDREMATEYRPIPFHSSLFEGPIQTGKDMWSSCTPYSRCSISPCGAPNVGDSLAAIKKVVFDDKKTTMQELVDALDVNFEGYEILLKMLSDAPKYGNDNDYVDDIVNEVVMHAVEVITPLKGCHGTKMNVSPAALTGNVPLGSIVGALPDGRLAGQPISEGGISPYQGRNVSGPLATYRSVGKLIILDVQMERFSYEISPEALKIEFL